MIGRVLRVLGVATLVASFGVWVYAFSGQAGQDAPDLLDDPSWAEAAEPICSAALADVEGLPGALDADDSVERSEQVHAASDRFEMMVDELRRLPTSTGFDSDLTAAWLDDWNLLIEDRRRYADAVAVDPAALFTISNVGTTVRLDKRITRLATVNAMPSCATPTDV